MTAWRTVRLVVIALAVTTSCTSTSPSDSAPSPHHATDRTVLGTSAPPTDETSSEPSTGSRALTVTKVGDFMLGDGDIGPLRLAGSRAIFPLSQGGYENWDQVGVLNTVDGSQRIVARSRWSDGLINWVAGTGHWVAWADQSRRQSDSDPNVSWRLFAKDLRTGEKRLLASNADTPDPFVPQVVAQDGYLFWTQAEPDRTARELLWRAGWRRPRALLTHAEMTPGSESASNGQLIYLSRAAKGHAKHSVGGDCWAVDLQGGLPHPLTHSALAMGCAASDGWLVWTQHIDPNTRHLPPDGILDDPYTLWGKSLSTGESQLIHRGYLAMGYPDVGDRFTVWPSGGSAEVHSLVSAAEVRLRPGDPSFPAAEDGTSSDS